MKLPASVGMKKSKAIENMVGELGLETQPPCTEEEQAMGANALEVMSSLYASITGTTVLQQKCVPPRPARDTRMHSQRDALDGRLADAAQARLKFLLSQSDIFGHFGGCD